MTKIDNVSSPISRTTTTPPSETPRLEQRQVNRGQEIVSGKDDDKKLKQAAAAKAAVSAKGAAEAKGSTAASRFVSAGTQVRFGAEPAFPMLAKAALKTWAAGA